MSFWDFNLVCWCFFEEGIWCFFSIRTTLIGMNILCIIPQNTHSSKRYKRVSTTVDGRNPAPAGMFSNPVNSGINYQPQLVSRISAMNSKVSVQPFTSLMEIGFFSILLKIYGFPLAPRFSLEVVPLFFSLSSGVFWTRCTRPWPESPRHEVPGNDPVPWQNEVP